MNTKKMERPRSTAQGGEESVEYRGFSVLFPSRNENLFQLQFLNYIVHQLIKSNQLPAYPQSKMFLKYKHCKTIFHKIKSYCLQKLVILISWGTSFISKECNQIFSVVANHRLTSSLKNSSPLLLKDQLRLLCACGPSCMSGQLNLCHKSSIVLRSVY